MIEVNAIHNEIVMIIEQVVDMYRRIDSMILNVGISFLSKHPILYRIPMDVHRIMNEITIAIYEMYVMYNICYFLSFLIEKFDTISSSVLFGWL
jgi:hypothetical protein